MDLWVVSRPSTGAGTTQKVGELIGMTGRSIERTGCRRCGARTIGSLGPTNQSFSPGHFLPKPSWLQGIKRLYPHNFDRRRELRKLNHSLLVNFLDLLDLLVRCPESGRRAEKVEDLSLLFIHIHHLLNEFRPHQARETLRVMMELQKRQRHEISQRFQKHLDKVSLHLFAAV